MTSSVQVAALSGAYWRAAIHQDLVDITSGEETPDETWHALDAAGHEHRWDGGGYPTLELVVDAEHWCAGDEGAWPHDPHMAIDASHYECATCREVVTPATRPPGYPRWMRSGPLYGELVGQRAGLRLTLSLGPLEVAELVSAARAGQDEVDEVVERLLESPPAGSLREMATT